MAGCYPSYPGFLPVALVGCVPKTERVKIPENQALRRFGFREADWLSQILLADTLTRLLRFCGSGHNIGPLARGFLLGDVLFVKLFVADRHSRIRLPHSIIVFAINRWSGKRRAKAI
jgi:hypothetical protein